MNDQPTTPPPSSESSESAAPHPSLPRRLVMTFTSPGALADALARRPVWFGALLVGAVLVVASQLAIPTEVWEEMARAQMMASGQEGGEGAGLAGNIIRIFAVVGGLVFWAVWAFLVAGVATLVFAFILGDDGRYRQYLAMTCHAMVIAGVGSLLVAPLRAAQRDPQLVLSVGTLVGELEGYFGRLLQGLDLFMLWSVVVLAVGVARFGERRTTGSAAAVLLVLWVGVTALFALIPTPG